MKKILLLQLLLMTTLFVSCVGMKESPKVQEKPFDIVRTKWEADYHFSKGDPKSALVNVVFDFKSPTEVVFVHKIKNGFVDPQEFPDKPIIYNYTYVSPLLKILSHDKKKWTVYKVDEKAGTMSTVRDEWVNKDEAGLIIGEEDDYKITLHLKK
ncbi:hypothetical protein IX332_000439 [Porphyromonas levii]|uniref:hypothetical protein n=1 Tax=Porphyromonas levii TaxID=28114 RepID=UPI001B8B397E|nr:hypothetical protein [Porphyromonas levii]MBR8729129.1 hypothetical protein [Porphyromonas levii]